MAELFLGFTLGIYMAAVLCACFLAEDRYEVERTIRWEAEEARTAYIIMIPQKGGQLVFNRSLGWSLRQKAELLLDGDRFTNLLEAIRSFPEALRALYKTGGFQEGMFPLIREVER